MEEWVLEGNSPISKLSKTPGKPEELKFRDVPNYSSSGKLNDTEDKLRREESLILKEFEQEKR